METIERYGMHTPKKKHGGLTAVLIVLAVLLAAVAILSWLAFSDPYAGKGLENVKPSDESGSDIWQNRPLPVRSAAFPPMRSTDILPICFRSTKRAP